MASVTSVFVAAACNRTVNSAAWGGTLICYASSKKLILYDPDAYADCGRVILTVTGHKGDVNAVRWVTLSGTKSCTDELYLLSASKDKTARLWAVRKQADGGYVVNTVAEMIGHKDSVNDVDGVIYPGAGEVVLTTISTDSTMMLWQGTVVTGIQCIQVIEFKGRGLGLTARIACFGSFDVPLVFCARDDCSIEVYALDQSKSFVMAEKLFGHKDWVRSIDFIRKDEETAYLASGSQDTSIRIWKITKNNPSAKETGDSLQLKLMKIKNAYELQGVEYLLELSITLDSVLMGHEGWVYGVQWGFRATGKQVLLSASSDKTMVLWSEDEDSGLWLEDVRIGDIGGNQVGFFGCMMSPDAQKIIGHSRHGAFQVWTCLDQEAQAWKPSVGFGGHFGKVEDLAWEPKHGSYLLSTGTDQTTRLFSVWRRTGMNGNDVESWHELGRPQVHGHDLSCISCVTDTCFVSGSEEKVVRAFRAPKDVLETLSKLTKDGHFLESVTAGISLPVGASMPALGLSNKAVFASEAEKRHTTKNEEGFESPFKHVDLEAPPTEDLLLQNCLWPEEHKLYAHPYEIFALSAAPDGTRVASACKASQPEHSRIAIWDTKSWTVKQWLSGHTLTITQLLFSPDGLSLLSVSRDRSWCLFSSIGCNDLKLTAKMTNKPKVVHSRIIWACDWTPDSKYFVTVSRDKRAVVWKRPEFREEIQDNSDPERASSVLQLKESINSVAVAPRKFSDDAYVLAFGLETGEILFYSWTNESSGDIDWSHLYTLDQGQAHCDLVKRLCWKPEPPEQDSLGGPLLLASCSHDMMVRIHHVRFPLQR